MLSGVKSKANASVGGDAVNACSAILARIVEAIVDIHFTVLPNKSFCTDTYGLASLLNTVPVILTWVRRTRFFDHIACFSRESFWTAAPITLKNRAVATVTSRDRKMIQ